MWERIFNELRESILEGAGSILNGISGAALNIFDINVVKNVLGLFFFIGWILVSIGILFSIANMVLNYIDGDSNIHRSIINIVIAIISVYFLSSGAEYIFTLAYKIQNAVTTITSINSNDNTVSLDFVLQISTITNKSKELLSLGAFWILVVSVIFIMLVCIIFFQMLKRSGLYLVQIIIGYLHLFSIPSGEYSGFYSWIKMTIAIAITNTLQLSLFLIAMNILTSIMSPNDFFIGIGLLIASTEVERLTSYFGFSTSPSRGFSTAVRSVSSVVTMAKILKR